MQLYDFYKIVLPPVGTYALFRTSTRKHLWAESIEQLVELTDQNDHHSDVYFATATFNEAGSRTQDNVEHLKAFRLDLDAGATKLAKHGAEKVYETQQAAIEDFVRFSKDAQLAPSLLVSSGEGLHVYYVLDDVATPEQWTPVAKQFQRFGVSHQLKIDSAVTADSARILRPVGTPHPNGNTVRVLKATGKVYTLKEFAAAVGCEAETAPKFSYDLSINEEIERPEGPPKSIMKVLSHCRAANYAAKHQAAIEEPYWRAMIGLVKHTVEGRPAAHMLSNQHPEYDPDITDDKFDRWVAGPTTCERFAEFMPKACAGCKYRGKVKSPISLGVMNVEEVAALPEEKQPAPKPAAKAEGKPWDGFIPDDFDVKRTRSGGYVLTYTQRGTKMNDQGEEVPTVTVIEFTHNIFWFEQWAEADSSTDTAQVIVKLWTGRNVRSYTMDQSLIASQSKLLEYFSGKAIHATTHKKATQAMQDYSKALLQRIKEAGKRPRVSDHLGLRILDDGELVCAHGKHIIYPDGTIQEGMLSPHLVNVASQFPLPVPESLTGSWGPEVWDVITPKAQQHIDFMKKYYGGEGMERFQLAIMLGLSSPLMPFVTGEFHVGSTLPRNSSLSVSLYSRESARGKTTAVMSAILAFGLPAALTNDSGKAGTTDNARISRLSIHGTMPNIMDEMGGASPASVASVISAVANGAAKERSTKDGGLNTSPPWALMNMMTTNTSQRDMINAVQDTSGAIQYRLLEINVEDMPEYDQEMRNSFTEDWSITNRQCTGALGAVIHRAICEMGVVQANKLVTECCARASGLLNSSQTARFQYRGLGALLAMQLILKKLGMAPFELAPMVEAFKVAHDAGNEYVVENTLPTDGLELLSRALQDLAPYTIITPGETHPGKNSNAWDIPLNERFPDRVVARHIQTSAITHVSVHALKEWCHDKGVSERDIIRQAVIAGALRFHPVKTATGGVSNRTSEKYNLAKGLKGNMELYCRAYTVYTRKLVRGYSADNIIKLHEGIDIGEDSTEAKPEAESAT